MSFETRFRNLASEASLNVNKASERLGLLVFTMESGVNQPVFVLPFEEIWEFSTPSMLAVDDIDELPKFVLATLLLRNSKNKRGFWCIEAVEEKLIVTAMTNVPEASITAAEFERICRNLVYQVELLEQIVRKASQ